MQGSLPTMQSMLPAMFILIVPAFVVCLAITVVAYRRRDNRHGE